MTDPRYDPRYQRGWDGEAPPAPRADPRPRVSPLPSPPVAPAASTDPVVNPLVVAPVDGAPTPTDPEPTAEPRAARRNPFRLALVVGGLALLVISGGLIWQSAQPQLDTGPQSPGDFLVTQITTELTPMLLLAGIVALVTAIALGALVRRR